MWLLICLKKTKTINHYIKAGCKTKVKFFRKKLFGTLIFPITPLEKFAEGPNTPPNILFSGSGFHRHHSKALSVETTNYPGLPLTAI
jgi:hypothetical protein